MDIQLGDILVMKSLIPVVRSSGRYCVPVRISG